MPKFCTHVRIYSLTSKKKIDPPHPGGGFRGLYIVKNLSRRIPPKFGTHVRIYSHLKKKKNLTHPTPGGFRGLYIVKNLSRRIAPKFGTHVQIDTLTLKKIFFAKFGTHVRRDTLTLKKKKRILPPNPTPGGFRGLYIVKNLSRRTAPKFGTHVQIDTLTLKKIFFDPPHPRGFRGLNCLARLALARERTPSTLNCNIYFNNPNHNLYNPIYPLLFFMSYHNP